MPTTGLRAALGAVAALLVGGCGGGGATATTPPVQDHVHAAVAGHAPGEILLGSHYGLRISEDGGLTWPATGDLAHSQMRLLTAAGGGFVAATARDDGSSQVLFSTDARHWQPAGGIPGGHLVSTLIPGSAPGSVWAEVTDLGIFGSEDGGHTWTAVLPTPLTINDMAAGVDGPDLFAYASSAGIFLSRSSRLVPLFDAPVLEGDVQSVQRWSACARCLVATVSGAVATSTDGGHRWTSHSTSLPFTTVQSWAGGGSTLLGLAPAPASPQHGVYRSTDAGATWTRVIDAPLVDRLYLPEGPAAPLLAFRWGISVYRSTDAGLTWAGPSTLRG